MSAAIRNPLSTAELAMVHAVHRAADAITRLIDDPATRPASLQAVEYLEGGRRRLRRISDDIDKVLQQFRDAQQSSAPPASPERVTLPGKRPAEVGGADLDAEFEAALADPKVPHERLSVYDSDSWRRVGLYSHYREVMVPCTQRDGHPDIQGAPILRALVAAFNAMLMRREKCQ